MTVFRYWFRGRRAAFRRDGWLSMRATFEDGSSVVVPRDVFLDRAVVSGPDVLWVWAPNPGAGRYGP